MPLLLIKEGDFPEIRTILIQVLPNIKATSLATVALLLQKNS